MDERNANQSGALTNLQAADLYRMQVRELRNYAMFMLDPDGIITSWNAGVEELLGYSGKEWVGQHACMIFTPAEKAVKDYGSEMQLVRERGSATNIRWHRHKSGTDFLANGFMNALHDEQGKLIGYAKIMSDETARKQLQDALTESNTALEQFAYAASHDLQEPLRTIRSYAQLLTRNYQGRLDADADRFLGFVMSAAARMSSLIH